MSNEEMSIETALEIVSAGSYQLRRFSEHYLSNPGVFLAIVDVANQKRYYKPRKLIRELIADIKRALDNSDGVLCDAAVSLTLLIDIICDVMPIDRREIEGVSPSFIPPDYLPSEEFVQALLVNFHYRMFPPAA